MATAQIVAETIVASRRMRLQRWAAKSRSWIALLVLAPFAIGALLSAPYDIEGSWQSAVFNAVGYILFVLGAGLRWWSTLYIGGRKSSTVVTQGPYSLCRNPLYFGTLLMAISVTIYLQSLTFLVGLFLAATIYLSTTIPVEERRLQSLFGSDYSAYCQRVPRLVPNFRGFQSDPSIEVTIVGLAAEGIRAARWIWLPVLCALVQLVRAQASWPHVFRLP